MAAVYAPQMAPGVVYAQPQQQGNLVPGQTIQLNKHTVTVERYLSQGGFATLYLVRTPTAIRGTTQHVLKQIAVSDNVMLDEVKKEVDVMRILRGHPNIVHLIDSASFALQDGRHEVYILMEFCQGGGIIDMMNRRLRERLTETEILQIFVDVCEGLAFMHNLKPALLHRDLKAENILQAGPVSFKLCNFRSSATTALRPPANTAEIRALEQDLNRHTTLQYRAPEIIDPYLRRPIDEKTDVWALGVLLYMLCYYTTPFEEHGPLAILNVSYKIPSLPVYSSRMIGLINSMLQEHGTARPTVFELLDVVHRIRGTTSQYGYRHRQRRELDIPMPRPVSAEYQAHISSRPQSYPIHSSPFLSRSTDVAPTPFRGQSHYYLLPNTAVSEPSSSQQSLDLPPQISLQLTNNGERTVLQSHTQRPSSTGPSKKFTTITHPAPQSSRPRSSSLGPDQLSTDLHVLSITDSQTPPDQRREWSQYIPSVRTFSGRYRRRTTRPHAYGGFSDVWICDAEMNDHTLKMVAMKELRPVNIPGVSDSETVLRRMLKRLEREVSVWVKLDHPHVVPLIGFRFQPAMRLFSPWYTNGDVKRWVASHPEVDTRDLMRQVAGGLSYLHSMNPPIAHGDIKSDNVLIDDQGNAVIIDFGLSQAIADISSAFSQRSSTSSAGNARWLAPELYCEEGCRRSTSSDVYAFGCLVLEIATGALPYRELSDLNVVLALANGNPPVSDRAKYPELEEDDPLWEVMTDCWIYDRANRPTMEEVEARLD